MLSRRPKFILIFVPVVLFWSAVLYYAVENSYQLRNTLSYATRPLWDTDDGPKDVIPHYYAEGMEMDRRMCRLHGWNPRPESALKVLDAILMSSELDLLEIRMNELDAVVDNFLIVESNATFTGLPKETFFSQNRARFAKFEHKIVYRFIPGYPLLPDQSAWDIEAHTRNTMTALLKSHVKGYETNTEVIVLMSDVDEIPSKHTVELLKSCNFGTSIHLQLRNYLYSFEWYIGPSSWRASAHLWHSGSIYRHSKSGETILADSGWHCSYCFRTLPEFVGKMKGFSHSDRIGGRVQHLDPKRIQDTICRGKDLFGMLPEAYSYLDFFSQMSLVPSRSAVGLPRYLIDNAKKFAFLLPNGCVREEASQTSM